MDSGNRWRAAALDVHGASRAPIAWYRDRIGDWWKDDSARAAARTHRSRSISDDVAEGGRRATHAVAGRAAGSAGGRDQEGNRTRRRRPVCALRVKGRLKPAPTGTVS